MESVVWISDSEVYRFGSEPGQSQDATFDASNFSE